jgi:hypothetical protein
MEDLVLGAVFAYEAATASMSKEVQDLRRGRPPGAAENFLGLSVFPVGLE